MSDALQRDSHASEYLTETVSLGLAPGEIVLGSLTMIDDAGNALVTFPQRAEGTSIIAVSTVAVSKKHIGRQVALLFANGDIQKPIIMGLIHSPLNDLLENFSMLQNIEIDSAPQSVSSDSDIDSGIDLDIDPFDGNELNLPEKKSSIETVNVDGKRIVIEGQEEIVLTCGESSITLTRAGKILIRGKYLLSRSSGVNRILGGSVQVN